jgi:hypothetical protein
MPRKRITRDRDQVARPYGARPSTSLLTAHNLGHRFAVALINCLSDLRRTDRLQREQTLSPIIGTTIRPSRMRYQFRHYISWELFTSSRTKIRTAAWVESQDTTTLSNMPQQAIARGEEGQENPRCGESRPCLRSFVMC